MAHFVEIDASNIVIRGVVLDDKDTQDENGDEVESVGAKYLSDGFGGTWKRTSYNTYGGVHNLGGTPFRKNYAGIGYTYDAAKDAFYSPKRYPSWTLNEDTCQWDAPTAYPDDGKEYIWNENTTSWDEV
tara:strand:+ start:81 stop:467 length:387 start_codon:yes stop_codon:yes gene_type:complete